MPVVDTGTGGARSGDRPGWAPPAVLVESRRRLAGRLPVAVEAWLLPSWCRPPLRPGAGCPIAQVSPDDRLCR